MKRNWIYIGILAIAFSVIFFSCEKIEVELWYKNQYVFIEQLLHEHSELIEGECLHRSIGSPIYGFDSSSGTLNVWTNLVKMNESIVMVLGDGLSLSGDAGSGMSSGIISISKLPYKQPNFSFTKIDSNGTVYFSYKDSIMMLDTNEEWVHVSTSIVPATDYNGDTIGFIKYTFTDRIKNWGLLKKKKFFGID